MAKAIPNPEVPQNGKHAAAMWRRFADEQPPVAPGLTESPLAELQALWDPENPLGAEDSENDGELLAALASESNGRTAAADGGALPAENARLRSIIAELRTQLEASQKGAEQTWEQQQKEYEGLLDEKSELIRTLHVKLQEIQNAAPPVPPTPKEEELIAMSEELERERCQHEQDRRELTELRKRLAEDEQTMLGQMRDMEVQMARERADYARRRTELQRILDDIRRELENADRNGVLNQRLLQLRERFQDVATLRPAHAAAEPSPRAPAPAATPARPESSPDAPAARGKDSGLIRRLFRK